MRASTVGFLILIALGAADAEAGAAKAREGGSKSGAAKAKTAAPSESTKGAPGDGQSNAGAGAAAAASGEADLVWVGRPDGARSCQPDSGEPLEKARASLEEGGIRVLDARKFSDNRLHVQMCGAEMGTWNLLRIAPADEERAKELGFARPGK